VVRCGRRVEVVREAGGMWWSTRWRGNARARPRRGYTQERYAFCPLNVCTDDNSVVERPTLYRRSAARLRCLKRVVWRSHREYGRQKAGCLCVNGAEGLQRER